MTKIKELLAEAKNNITDDIEQQILDDMYSSKKQLRKKYSAKCDDEITIQAAKEVATEYNVDFKEILKMYKPSGNIRGSKSWDQSSGKVITVQ